MYFYTFVIFIECFSLYNELSVMSKNWWRSLARNYKETITAHEGGIGFQVDMDVYLYLLNYLMN